MENKCEMCGKRNKSVSIGQCTSCHAEICDEPASECHAKQIMNRKLIIFGIPFYD